MPSRRLWYLRRGQGIQGPFPDELIRRYVILGRVREDDELSIDRHDWRRLSELPEFMPTTGGESLSSEDLGAVRRWEDERTGEERRREIPVELARPTETLRRNERRRSESNTTVQHRQSKRRTRILQKVQRRERYFGREVSVFLFVVLLIGLAIVFPDRFTKDEAQCDAPPKPNINWSNCRMEGVVLRDIDVSGGNLRNASFTGADLRGANLSESDLAYANLNIANLRRADLKGALLLGTSLRNADLSGANLQGADLSYAILAGAVLRNANLREAKLDKAIWTDNRICHPGSIGRCVTEADSGSGR